MKLIALRIARELHDTLLQSFQGLDCFRFQAAYEHAPGASGRGSASTQGYYSCCAAGDPGRNAIQEMRSPMVRTDLARAISALEITLAGDSNRNSAVFSAQAEGSPRDLHPILRDEIYRIAGEALRNAFRHAQARQIEALIHDYDRDFRCTSGMTEGAWTRRCRARRHLACQACADAPTEIPGTLEVWSEVDSGTEVELSIPASLAYAPARRRSRLFAKRTGTKA